jgi:NAD(P)-dependent dehydrogenase (short-subunit alcohol dehydrogenase family)
MSTAQQIFSVRGRRALVTGAASGFGLAIAQTLLANGASLHLLDADAQRLERVRAELAQAATLGQAVGASVVDVTDEAGVRAAVAVALERLGGLDIVFANAGITGGYGPAAGVDGAGRIDRLDRAQWRRTLDVNLEGVLNTLQATVPTLRDQGAGKVVVTASIAGLRANPLIGYAYTASKAALVLLTKELALELAPHGVQVNAIAPGPFRTHINGSRFHDPDNARAAARLVPLGRIGEPHEIQGVALLLASGASDFMTGSVLTIDGGSTAGA